MRYSVGAGDEISGQLYVPAGAGPHPIVIALHGGGWRLKIGNAYRHWGDYLARRGYALLDVDYRTVKDGRNLYPAAVEDVRGALRFVREQAGELGVDAGRIALMGDSAGAHLSALVALTTPSQVKAVVGVYGVYDMLAQWQHDQPVRPLDHITQGFLGKTPQEARALYEEASPIAHVSRARNGTAFLIAWGTHDDIVDSATQSEAFVRALKQAGFYVRTDILTAAGHFWMWDPIDEPGSHTALFAPRLARFLAERV